MNLSRTPHVLDDIVTRLCDNFVSDNHIKNIELGIDTLCTNYSKACSSDLFTVVVLLAQMSREQLLDHEAKIMEKVCYRLGDSRISVRQYAAEIAKLIHRVPNHLTQRHVVT
jgi:hypothetical protein